MKIKKDSNTASINRIMDTSLFKPLS